MLLQLSVPTLEGRVVPCVVTVALDMECPQGYVKQDDARGNVVCVECGVNYYESEGGCHACGEGMICDGLDQSLSRLELWPGYWRTHMMSHDVRKCRVGVVSCPGVAEIRENDTYCAPEYVGPLCSVCARKHFLTSENECDRCNQTGPRSTTIIFGTVLVICIALAGACIKKTGVKAKLMRLYKTGKMKGLMLVQVAQGSYMA